MACIVIADVFLLVANSDILMHVKTTFSYHYIVLHISGSYINFSLVLQDIVSVSKQ